LSIAVEEAQFVELVAQAKDGIDACDLRSGEAIGGGVELVHRTPPADATVRLRYSPVLSPRLNKQLVEAAAAQARLTAKVRNAVPPMLEGDIFSSLFEGATGWKVGTCQADAKIAHCPVMLSFTPPPAQNPKAPKPASWSDTLILTHTPQGWKVDDVVYDAGFQFGNTGRLSEMLQMVIAANPR